MATSSLDPQQSHSPKEPASCFASILFAARGRPEDLEERPAPDCLHDLNLDQAIEAITAQRDDYDLVPFFQAPLRRGDDRLSPRSPARARTR